MSSLDVQHCVNHPGRVALEKCEVCGKPLCAYCLYYTEDGQRLCAEHADSARQLGLHIEEPGLYAEHLVGAQAGAFGKAKRGPSVTDDPSLYHGNSTDLMAFVGMLFSVLSAIACCGAIYCLPIVGLLMSLAALLSARNAHDPRRARRFGLIGLLASAGAVALIVACVALSMGGNVFMLNVPMFGINPGGTAIKIYPSETPTEGPSPTPRTDTSDSAALQLTPTVEGVPVPR